MLIDKLETEARAELGIVAPLDMLSKSQRAILCAAMMQAQGETRGRKPAKGEMVTKINAAEIRNYLGIAPESAARGRRVADTSARLTRAVLDGGMTLNKAVNAAERMRREQALSEGAFNRKGSVESGAIRIEVSDCWDWFARQPKNSVDLVLTDPPYTISRDTGFSQKGVKRLGVSMNFGDWDHAIINLPKLAREAYRVLKRGGTAIVFYDLWKITNLRDALEAAGFRMLRLIEWRKTNPVPLNSKRFYLSNSRELAVAAVKGGKPTFNSEYDGGYYEFGIPRGGADGRIHPTQKPDELFRGLIEKHSRRGDLVVDPFLGGGTTAVAAYQTERRFAGCDASAEYIRAVREERFGVYD